MHLHIIIIFISSVFYTVVSSHEKSCEEIVVIEALRKLSDCVDEKNEEQDKRISSLEEKFQALRAEGCLAPPDVANGNIINLTGRKPSDSFTVECNTGYKLKGDNPVSCKNSGNWTKIPSCEPVACGFPRIPNNGSINEMNGYGFGATIKIRCDEGFYISGNPVVTCSSNGNWNSVPSCEIVASCISNTVIDNGFTNVALGKKVILSSLYNAVSPGSLMVDGSRSSTYPCACTRQSQNPYAVVDLQEAYDIHLIYIVNRGDCCPERLHDLAVFVGNDTSRLGLAARHRSPVGAGCVLKFDKPVNGRYVKLQIEASAAEFLTICELEIYSI